MVAISILAALAAVTLVTTPVMAAEFTPYGHHDTSVTQGDVWINDDGVTMTYSVFGHDFWAFYGDDVVYDYEASCSINGDEQNWEWSPNNGRDGAVATWVLLTGEYTMGCDVVFEGHADTHHLSNTIFFDPNAPPNQPPLVLRSPNDVTIEGVGLTAEYGLSSSERVVTDDYYDVPWIGCEINEEYWDVVGGMWWDVDGVIWWDLPAGTHEATCWVTDQLTNVETHHTVTVVLTAPEVPQAATPPAQQPSPTAPTTTELFPDERNEPKIKRLSTLYSRGVLTIDDYGLILKYFQSAGIINFDIQGDPSAQSPYFELNSDDHMHGKWNGHAGASVSNAEYKRYLESVADNGYFDRISLGF